MDRCRSGFGDRKGLGVTGWRGGVVVGAAVVATSFLSMAPGGAHAATRSAAVGADPTETWPMFGHDALHSAATTDSDVTSLTAPKLRVGWSRNVATTAVPISASPVVAYDATLGKTLVYEINAAGRVDAFDADSGAVVWQTTVPFGIVGPDQAQEDVSTPTIDGDTLYVGTTGALVAMDATTGAVDCTFDTPVEPPATQPGVIDSSPVVGDFDPSGPIVYFGDKGQSEAFNGGHEWAVTGVGNTAGACQQVWMYDGWQVQKPPDKLAGSWSSPALVQSANGTWLLVFGSSDPDDAVYALDASTGALVWRFQTTQYGPDEDVGAGPTISPPGANGFPDGVVYVVGKDAVEFAIDLSTGAEIWSFDMSTDTGTSLSVDAVSSGALDGNVLDVPYAQWVYAFDATTGAVLWRTDVGGGVFYASSSISVPASGASGDPVLVLGNTLGDVYALDATSGSVLSTVSLGSAIFSSAAISGSEVFEANAVGKLVALTVVPPTPKVNLSGDPVPGDNTYGVTLTVPADDPAPTGTVTVSDSGGGSCSVSLTGSGTTYTGDCTIDAETAGQKVTASFGGDADYNPAISAQTLTVRAPVPAVAAVSPDAGPLRGGTVITITGTGFANGARVTIGTVRATHVQIDSATEITATTPRGCRHRCRPRDHRRRYQPDGGHR